ncbi:MAG: sulfotransferase [Chloroflexota bacterium]
MFDRENRISLSSRIRQARFLLGYILFCPFWTLLWYIDEILFPDYRQIKHRSLFIIGQPRSGTTFLHRTLATDENTFVAIRHYEWRYPFITLQILFGGTRVNEIFKARNYWPNTERGRMAAKMHSNTLYDWEEDGIFFEECFLHHFFIWLRFPYPNLLAYLDDFVLLPDDAQKHMIKTYQKAVQKVMYLRGEDKIYLSKEVTGQQRLMSLVECFPDAEFLVVARHSNAYMNSLLELVKTSTAVKTGIDPNTIPEWRATFIARMCNDCVELLNFLSQFTSEKQVHLSFDLLTQHIVASIQIIYDQFELSLSDNYKHYLEMLQQHQENRCRGYDYSFSAIQNLAMQGFVNYDIFVDSVAETHQKHLRFQKAVTVSDVQYFVGNYADTVRSQ